MGVARSWRTAAAYVVACAAGGLLTGCVGDRAPDVDVLGSWVLVSGRTPGGPLDVPERSRVTLTFEDGAAGGRGPCNDYGADYDLDGDRFDLSEDGISQTLAGCDGPLGDLESAYVSGLNAVDHLSREGDTLTMSGTDTELVLAWLPPWPRAEVVGRTWRLVSWTDDSGAVHRPAGEPGMPAHVRIDEKGDGGGLIEASTGCRTMTGRWVDRRDSLTVVRASWDGTCRSSLMAQEMVVGDSLSEPIVELRGADLVLRNAHGSSPAEAVFQAQ